MAISASPSRGRAASYIARANLEILKAAAARASAHGRGVGARPPAALAPPSVQLGLVHGAVHEPGTPVGHKTARRRWPRVIGDLSPSDPRVCAATMLADAFERVGSVRGVDLSGGDSSAGQSDGGATTRVKHAARLRLIEYHVNGWPIDRVHGPDVRMCTRPRRLVLAVQRKRPGRHSIQAFAALVSVCVNGDDLSMILARHGWSVQAANRTQLRDGILAVLDDVARALGLTDAPR